MDVVKIPFVKKVGIEKTPAGRLELKFTDDIHNHLNTIHASAQFALAETASGEFLQTLFTELVGVVIPVLRESSVKFKKPAVKTITAYPSISDESVIKFNHQFSSKGWASITVDVEVKDSDNMTTCTCYYKWFIQKLEE